MKREDVAYRTYVEILKRELVPAMGCTEPIAIAYGSAKARAVLGEEPVRVKVLSSGNIIKNVKSVIVPHTGGMKGIAAAAAVGVLYGDAEADLEVISAVTKEQIGQLPEKMKEIEFVIGALDSDHVLDIEITAESKDHVAKVRIMDEHTNVVEMTKDGVTVENVSVRRDGCTDMVQETDGSEPDYSLLNVADIVDFANTADLSDVEETLARQLAYNTAISNEGLTGNYGARIGQILLRQDDSVRTRAKAAAAAGSDARMNGCELPVVINSGSGNQGITASMPVLTYAKHYEKTEEELYRALLVSNLVSVHLKTGIGRLSAYCGAVSAGVGAGAGIAYLLTGDLDVINHTIVNAVAINSGIVCDGAKASCAAKIAMAVDAGILGYEMYQMDSQFYDGDGLVTKGVENTIANIAILGSEGMKETDKTIIGIMTK